MNEDEDLKALAASLGLSEEAEEPIETEVEKTEEPIEVPEAVEPTTEEATQDEAVEANEDTEKPSIDVDPDFEARVDALLSEDSAIPSPEAQASQLDSNDVEADAAIAKLTQECEYLKAFDGLATPEGVVIPNLAYTWTGANGQPVTKDLTQFTKSEVDFIATELAKTGQLVESKQLVDAYLDYNRTQQKVQEALSFKLQQIKQYEGVKAENEFLRIQKKWETVYEKRGAPLTKPDIEKAREWLTAKYENDADFPKKPKEQQVEEALRYTGLLVKLQEKNRQVIDPAAPDAKAQAKSVKKQVGRRPADLNRLDRMSDKEFINGGDVEFLKEAFA